MKNATPRTLEQMQNYATRYEVAVSVNGETFVANYMVRKSRDALIAVARDNSEHLLNFINEGEEWKYSRARGLEFNANVRVYFTGRTERDARISMGA